MGTNAASEPHNFFIIVIYNLLPTDSFLLIFLLVIAALATSQICFMILLKVVPDSPAYVQKCFIF